MAVITVADVLKHAEEFEQMLAEYYENLAEHATKEGVRLLAEYIGRHRVRMNAALEKLAPEQMHRIRNTPLRYEPHAADCRCFQGMELPPNATGAQVVDVAVTFDECLVRLYRQVVRQPVDREVSDFFESLIQSEQSDEIQLKKIKAADYF